MKLDPPPCDVFHTRDLMVTLCSLQYEKTRSAVYDVEGATESLLELMQVYRDKGFIFSCACTLMGIMGMMENRRKVGVLKDSMYLV